MPIYSALQHGWYSYPDLHFQSHSNKQEIMSWLTWNKKNHNILRVNSWQKAIVGCPYVHYRKFHSLKKKPDASGTIFYPQHGTKKSFVDRNYNALVQELKSLPPLYQPITVSLVYDDYLNDKIRNKYEEHFTVKTPGDPLSDRYILNFYTILHAHKYAMGDDVTTASLLAIESRIPFFLSKTKSFSYRSKISGKKSWLNSDSKKKFHSIKIFHDLFGNTPITSIDKSTIDIVNEELGIGQASHIIKIYLVIVLDYINQLFKKRVTIINN